MDTGVQFKLVKRSRLSGQEVTSVGSRCLVCRVMRSGHRSRLLGQEVTSVMSRSHACWVKVTPVLSRGHVCRF